MAVRNYKEHHEDAKSNLHRRCGTDVRPYSTWDIRATTYISQRLHIIDVLVRLFVIKEEDEEAER